MEPLAFVATRRGERGVSLTSCAACDINPTAWDEFAGYVALEPGLMALPGHVFRSRWEQGNAAVAVRHGHILSYTSLVAILDEAFKAQLAAVWPYLDSKLPPVDMFMAATGWTHPEWRHNNINLNLRYQLLQRFSAPDILCVGVTIGLGAGPVLTRLGWCVLPWSQIAYVSSLIAVPLAGYEDQVGQGWLVPHGSRLYEGPPLTYEGHSSHPWKQFSHFWVAREDLAQRLDTALCAASGGDLRRWRDAIVRARFVAPAPSWKLNFYEEQMLCPSPC